ncbi:MAG: ATP-binding protein [Flammeovirgaceae bacterium]|nr:ATP-binding protein [Flammeovirgaceae bacterium]MDW8286574.1 ATP-binding protein [Flammeovirgaceae bacterium]
MEKKEEKFTSTTHLLNPRAVAILLAICVAGITLLFLSLVENVGIYAMLVVGSVAFSSCFILVFITLKYLIFNELARTYEELTKLRQKNKPKEILPASIASSAETSQDSTENKTLPAEKEVQKTSNHPIRRINEEIANFASIKEEELKRLRKMEAYRREFLADVSHELKTPIFAAQSYILTLLDGAMNDSKVRHKFLKKAAKSLSALNSLVQDLLTISQLESGVITMKPEYFDFVELMQDVFDQLEHKAKKRKVRLRLHLLVQSPCIVYADRMRIMQVMINLVANSIKYHKPEGGWVRVSIHPSEDCIDEIVVEVADNGIGIPPEHQARVFERFYRVDKSRSRKQGGTGLGLAIVKHILEGHKSKIKLESEVDVGTTLRFTLKKGKPTEQLTSSENNTSETVLNNNIHQE